MTLKTTDSEPPAPTPPPSTPSSPPDFEWSDKLALERIEAITRNARATWFGLLGLLAFVMVTLLGVEDIDFFGYDRDTALPLVGVAVPTITFFVAAPILAAAVYAYFHFYLMKLWDALGRAPARVFNDPIGDLIHPWLLSDAALVLRDNLQIRDDDKAIRQERMANEGAAAIRPLRWVSALTSAALTWVAGWVTLGYAWVISWPAHEEWLSLLILGCFLFSLWVGAASLWTIWVRVGRRDFAPKAAKFWRGRRRKWSIYGFTMMTALLSWNKTEGGLERYLEAVAVDLSRFDAAPLIAFIAAKEMNYGTETDGRIPS